MDENDRKSSGRGLHGAGCSACEMAVVWMQNQLGQNQTRDQILSYINNVSGLSLFFYLSIFVAPVDCKLHGGDWSYCSFVIKCLVQWENQLLTVGVSLLCLSFP